MRRFLSLSFQVNKHPWNARYEANKSIAAGGLNTSSVQTRVSRMS